MNKFVKGYLIGKLIEVTIAGTAMLVAKQKGYFPTESKEDFILKSKKKSIRKRLAR